MHFQNDRVRSFSFRNVDQPLWMNSWRRFQAWMTRTSSHSCSPKTWSQRLSKTRQLNVAYHTIVYERAECMAFVGICKRRLFTFARAETFTRGKIINIDVLGVLSNASDFAEVLQVTLWYWWYHHDDGSITYGTFWNVWPSNRFSSEIGHSLRWVTRSRRRDLEESKMWTCHHGQARQIVVYSYS